MLMVCSGYIFAQTQKSSPPQGGGATELDSRMEQAIDMMFREMDTDHDGKISKKEWMDFQEKQFRLIDKNGDGFITKDEVRADMKEMRKKKTPQ
jgi:Ca2+-binding EF-hand superfamily protein